MAKKIWNKNKKVLEVYWKYFLYWKYWQNGSNLWSDWRREQFFQHLKCLAEGNEELTAWMSKRGIFQNFQKTDFGAKFLFIELDTTNFWQLAFFSFFWTVPSFEEDWTTFILHILQGFPFDVFCFCNLPKIQRGDLNVVQSSSNLAQFSKMKK